MTAPTPSRARELAEEAAAEYFRKRGGQDVITLKESIEAAIIAAIKEALGEPSSEMGIAGTYDGFWIASVRKLWKTMAAQRLRDWEIE